MRVLDLFTGIGGFSLGLQRAGMETVAMCEIDIWCRETVLAHNFPGVPVHDDITTLDAAQFRGVVDVVCGGFPCQGISLAGLGRGLQDERSRLWFEMLRVIGECRPRWAIIENSQALFRRGLQQVLLDIHSLGYDAVWHVIPAAAVGAKHLRERIWIVAHAAGEQLAFWQSFSSNLAKELAAIARDNRMSAESGMVPGVHAVPRQLAGWRKQAIHALGNALVPGIPEAIGRSIMTMENSLAIDNKQDGAPLQEQFHDKPAEQPLEPVQGACCGRLAGRLRETSTAADFAVLAQISGHSAESGEALANAVSAGTGLAAVFLREKGF